MNEHSSTLIDDNTGYTPKRTRRFCAFLLRLAVLYILTFTSFFGYSQEPTEDAQEATDDTATAASAPITSEPQPLDFIATDIASMMHEDQYQLIDITFDEGGENELEHQFPVFVKPSQKPLSMGTFYLVSDVAYNGAQIGALMALAEQMSVLGWNSVVMPAPALMMVMAEVDAKKAEAQAKANAELATETTESTEPAADAANDTNNADTSTAANDAAADAANDSGQPEETTTIPPPTDKPNIQTMVAARHHQSTYDALYQEAFNVYLTRFLLATMSATEKPGYQVFFAQGMSAQALINISPAELAPDAIVINNLYWPQRTINQTLAMQLAQTVPPVLDLIGTQDNHWALATEHARQITAKVEVKSYYRQRQVGILGLHSDISGEMAKEIYGWLTYLGW